MSFKGYFVILGITLLILLIPLTVMQFTNEVDWSVNDFIVFGILFFSISALIKLVTDKLKTHQFKIFIILALIILFLLIWAELAVGVFGTPFAGS